MAAKKTKQTRLRAGGETPITVGGGGRGLKLWLQIDPSEWDTSTFLATGYMRVKDVAKGAKKLTLSTGDVSITVPLKGPINLDITVG
jgi:hypothetical protein